jgi:hypothetical protein
MEQAKCETGRVPVFGNPTVINVITEPNWETHRKDLLSLNTNGKPRDRSSYS